MKHLASLLLVLALGMAACLPERLTDSADTGVENPPTDGDNTLDSGGTVDVLASDGATPTEDAGKGPDAVAGADLPPAKGCKTDDECGGFASDCVTATCNVTKGLCSGVPMADGATCTIAADKCADFGQCQKGDCVAPRKSCEDNNVCTTDTCITGGGCKNDPINGFCNDGDACTINEKCDGIVANGGTGLCIKSTSPADCDDKNTCTVDSCDKLIGCLHDDLGDGKACIDGNPCTTDDLCAAKVCVGQPLICPPSAKAPCVIAVCTQVAKGCSNQNNDGIACSDDNACTTADVCGDGICTGKAFNKDAPDNACDDKNVCTNESCTPADGCQHFNTPNPCGGGDTCTEKGLCEEGVCNAKAKDCNDGNVCTVDSCDLKKGCVHVANTADCSDGSLCTVGDICDQGVCKAGAPPKCDDKNDCTIDSCKPDTGCAHDFAVGGAKCAAGLCAVGLCLTDDCGDGLCALTESPDGCAADCSVDGGACKPSETTCIADCQSGKCKALLATCTANDACKALSACNAKCADKACENTCFNAVPYVATEAFLAVNACSVAFCINNGWSTKKCVGVGPAYTNCVDTCETAYCKKQSTLCKASTGCVAIRGCMQACQVGDVKCADGCKKFGSAQDLLNNADLDTCSVAYCQ